MADSDLLVTISGAAFSLLFYENVRSVGDQMGFLLGESLEFVIKTYTDSDHQTETVKICNNVETVVPCPLPDLIHDSTGRINKTKIKDFLGDHSKQVIGWFRFRRNAILVPTMRDKILHKEFASYFSNGSKPELFVMCLLNAVVSAERGTHKFRHVFLRQKRGLLEPVPLRIINLGNDFRKDGSEYKPTPVKKSSCDAFTSLVESLCLDLTRTAGLEAAVTIQKAAEEYLDELIPQVCESDLEVAELERKVRELKKAKFRDNYNGCLKNYDMIGSASKDRIGEKTSDKSSWSRGAAPYNGRPPFPSNRTRNTAALFEDDLNQDKMNRRHQEPFVNTVQETRANIKDAVLTRSMRSSGSEIVKESICKGEGIDCGAGRGRGKLTNESGSNRRSTRLFISDTIRPGTERNLHATQILEREHSLSNYIQSSPTSLNYSDVAKKNLGKLPDQPENH